MTAGHAGEDWVEGGGNFMLPWLVFILRVPSATQ
jgi:hypothetical protein